MGDEAKSLASEARRSRSERDADRLCRTESLPLIPTIKAWWWDSEKRQKLLQHIKKSPRSVDTERGNEYNTYRVRPKRSAVYKYVFSLIKGVTVLWQQGGYLCRNFMIVIVSISCLSARMSAIINSSILHTSFRMVC